MSPRTKKGHHAAVAAPISLTIAAAPGRTEHAT